MTDRMRLSSVLLLAVLVGSATGGLSGTYIIRSDGSGDFLNLYHAGSVLRDSGLSGNVVLELYGDTLDSYMIASSVAGSDTWTTTIRPGPGESPVLADGPLLRDRILVPHRLPDVLK